MKLADVRAVAFDMYAGILKGVDRLAGKVKHSCKHSVAP